MELYPKNRRVETPQGDIDIPETVCQWFLEYCQESNLLGIPADKRPSDTWEDFRLWLDLLDEPEAVEFLTKLGKENFSLTLLWFYVF